jgi:endonuclease YncB( thermonuclease family)
MGNCCFLFRSAEYQNEIDMLEIATKDNVDFEQYYFKKAKIVKVYDGDTFTIVAKHNNQLTKFNTRLYGIDCPELKSTDKKLKELALDAKKFTNIAIMNKIVDIEVLNNTKVNGRLITEKFGRLLVNIKYDGKDLANELLKNNLAKKYFGGTKEYGK